MSRNPLSDCPVKAIVTVTGRDNGMRIKVVPWCRAGAGRVKRTVSELHIEKRTGMLWGRERGVEM